VRDNGDVRCGDCREFAQGGWCESAGEHLRLDRWPRGVQVRVPPSADAQRCPGFAASEAYLEELAERRGFDRMVEAVARLKGHVAGAPGQARG
jgi:hypothetical protein